MLGFRLPFARRKGYGMGAAGGGNEGASVLPSGLLTSLVSYWTLDEASGTRVDSVITSGNDLTDNNTVTQAVGKLASAAQFTSANLERLSRADNASLSTGDIDFTVSYWVYADALSGFKGNVLKDGNAGAGTREWNAYFNGTTLTFDIYSAAGATCGTVTVAGLSTTTWYHVVAWHDSVANTVNLQVNGAAPVNAATTGVPSDSTAEFSIGGRSGGIFFSGRIDEVGFWKRVLTADERTNLYNAGAGVTYPFTGVP